MKAKSRPGGPRGADGRGPERETRRDPGEGSSAEETRRLDKWLWYARFFKTRSLATRFCNSRRLRVNERVISKAHYGLRVGDVLTFPKARDIRVVRVVALGTRRGPAPEAQTLYDDLDPPQPRKKTAAPPPAAARRDPGTGRPTKAERRATDRLKRRGGP